MSTRVLVVDNILVNLTFLEAKFSMEHYEVLTAGSGIEALETIQNGPPDIVLLDVMMPAFSDQLERVAGLEIGAHDVLTKPVHNLALFVRLRSLLRLKLLLDEFRLREETSCQMNILGGVENRDELMHSKRVLFVGEDPSEDELIAKIFDENIYLGTLSDSTEAM